MTVTAKYMLFAFINTITFLDCFVILRSGASMPLKIYVEQWRTNLSLNRRWLQWLVATRSTKTKYVTCCNLAKRRTMVNNVRSRVLARHYSIRIVRLGKMKCLIVMTKSVKHFWPMHATEAFRIALTSTLRKKPQLLLRLTDTTSFSKLPSHLSKPTGQQVRCFDANPSSSRCE